MRNQATIDALSHIEGTIRMRVLTDGNTVEDTEH